MLKYLCATTAERTFVNGAAVINEALHRQAHISTSSDDTRLETLGGRAELGSRSPASFNNVLQQVIRQLQLAKLFCPNQEGEFHRSICPAAYNERTGEHHPEEMARWRAEFRGMAPEQQMMAATIIWLYQSGPDSTWLRRVPCTWRAGEATQYMNDAGCLSLWLSLIARYPGW
jgi:hypothetical protein